MIVRIWRHTVLGVKIGKERLCGVDCMVARERLILVKFIHCLQQLPGVTPNVSLSSR